MKTNDKSTDIVVKSREAAADISNLMNCPEEVIRQLATLATSNEAFGDPSEWTAIQVRLYIFIVTMIFVQYYILHCKTPILAS